jgi:hypothetical protein
MIEVKERKKEITEYLGQKHRRKNPRLRLSRLLKKERKWKRKYGKGKKAIKRIL